jgi:hypothetical protein
MFLFIVIIIALNSLKEYTPINKHIDKASFGGFHGEMYTELNSPNSFRNSLSRNSHIQLDFHRKNFLIGLERSVNRTKDVGCNTNLEFRFFEFYNGINYLCYTRYTARDNGIRVGYIYNFQNSKFAFYSVLGLGQGELFNFNLFFGKYYYDYNYISINLGISFLRDFKPFTKYNLFYKLEFGIKNNYFENQFLAKSLYALKTDYSLSFGFTFQIDFKEL